jgi:sugar phosphate permease
MAVMVELIGWRYSFAVPAIILLIFTILAWFLMKPRPAQAIKAGEEIADTQTGDQEAAVTASGIAGKQFWKYSYFWPFAIWAFLVYGVLFSFTGLWGASYLQDSFNISREAAGTHLMFVSIGMICGGLFWGILSDRYFKARRPVLFIGTIGMLLTWATLVSFTIYPGPLLTSLLYFAIGIFSVTFLINLGCAKELFPVEIAGTAMGTVNAGMFVGVAVFQGVTGYLLDFFLENQSSLFAFRAIFILYTVCIAVALLMVFFMPESFPGHIKKPASL